jgi:predicted DsbA family dithiol-disulfide isomerase
MITRPPSPHAAALLAALAIAPACAARGPAATPAASPAAPAAAPAAPAPSADDPAAVLPGVDLEGLDEAGRRAVAELALAEFCPCGCPHTISACLREHRTCTHSARAARLAARLVRRGAGPEDLRRSFAAYYASFDRRTGPDPAAWGPALGSPDAKVTLLEISDFTCPFCRKVRPDLEAFVRAREGRVKLVYVPFPIESHPGALEAAQAAEWAREAGLFWPMHDALFEAAHPLSADELAALAEAAGGDGEALRAALGDGRHLPRVRTAQAAARAAGIRGTPTLFLNGRMLVVPDYSEPALEDALADEEEWVQHGGWARD